jgi:hypothetical protein
MGDDSLVSGLFDRKVIGTAPAHSRLADVKEGEEGSCAAFGYLRGLESRALALELRFRNGNRDWYSYNLLASWHFNPSSGLLLKFTGDLVTLILVRGSNLDVVLPDRGVHLTDRGLQRHRIVWIKEMDEDELRSVGQAQPTIDCIDVAEFESQDEVREWLGTAAPAFVRK